MVKNDFASASAWSVAYSSSSHIRKYTADASGTYRHRRASFVAASSDVGSLAAPENGATHRGPLSFLPLRSNHTSIELVRHRGVVSFASPPTLRTLCTTRTRAFSSSGCAKQ